MKKRLHDRKAGIAILISLIIISLAEIIFRAVTMGKATLTTSNVGEQLAVIALAVTILILTAKGKDRACYICYGAWAGYFILDQLFELPGNIVGFIVSLTGEIALPSPAIVFVIVVRASVVLSIILTIAIGILLVEYMTDGTIYNKAFNVLCIVTIVLILLNMALTVYDVIASANAEFLLATFHDLYRLTMIFLFTFFAYDSAKHQLKKANLSK
jgi:hypothetical protein